MHSIDYDEIHDEIVVPQQFAQAILTLRGSADGDEPPLRVIQGSRTQLGGSRRHDWPPFPRALSDGVRHHGVCSRRDPLRVFGLGAALEDHDCFMTRLNHELRRSNPLSWRLL